MITKKSIKFLIEDIPLLRILLNFKKRISLTRYKLISYSQEGEDLILNRIFENKDKGFYIDIGAHHPVRFSNTYFFYKKGWKGINVDAAPHSMQAFMKKRPRDINLEVPISLNSLEMEYFIFNESALNGFSKELSEKRNNEINDYKIINTVMLKSKRLENILEEFLDKNQGIDFLTIDVEGLDLEVLMSNNWQKYRPKIVLVEILSDDLEGINKDPVYQYLKEVGYILYAKSVNTCFFKLND